MVKRTLVLLYGVVCYAVFLATFLYAVGFLTNLAVPRSIDGPPVGGTLANVAVDVALLLLFAVQHSAMARPRFKRWLTRIVPAPTERSTYVLASSVALIVLFAFWRPLGGSVWSVEGTGLRTTLYALAAFGWALVLFSTFLINHFDLFGLRQVWLYYTGKPYSPLAFRTPSLYRLVRHPLYVGWLFAFWATPTMTLTHLLFAVATTGYILCAIPLEERDLADGLGEDYRAYRRRVPMLVPFSRRRGRGAPAPSL